MKGMYAGLCFIVATSWADPLVESLQFGSEPIYLGGYFSAMADIGERTQRLAIDEAALMLYGEYPRWGFMAEWEFDEPYTRYFGDDEGETTHLHGYIERLNAYYHFDDATVRFGKFFSSIGFWNQMPINVLRDTTSDPTFVYQLFPMLTTGIETNLYLDNGDILSLSLQHNNDLDGAINNFDIDRHIAWQYEHQSDWALWRMGGGWFRKRDNKESWYANIGFDKPGLEFSWLSEAGFRQEESERGYDIYLQGVWHYLPHHDLIGRIESFDDPIESRSRDIWGLVGYTWRPKPSMAFKTEVDLYVHRKERLLFSWSVMF
ncbi:hypothetical protein [Hydrogenimonas sp.]